MNTYHTSVLLEQTVEYLKVEPGKKYIDATLGGGGHAREIVKQGGKVLGIDFDQDALDYVRSELRIENGELRKDFVLVKGNFVDIDTIAREHGFEEVAGILFDLGVSLHQFDKADRGFSFRNEGPLDMRMDRDLNVKAKDLVNILSKGELYELFHKLGEERFAHAIADHIVRARRISPIQTTRELSEIVQQAVPRRYTEINPATRIFQALRIAVNDELNNLRDALPKAIKLIESGGRMSVISFHSLEDRIVKHQFKEWALEGIGTTLTRKPIVPTEEEIAANKASRSSKLRAFEKL
jgi:16S rRNA (cytosine1402-N4)-methyltransferase